MRPPVPKKIARSVSKEIPLYWSVDGCTADVVRCREGHVAFRETFEDVGGCPYCSYTPRERVALKAKKATLRRIRERAAE